MHRLFQTCLTNICLAETEEKEPGTISLSIAQVQNQDVPGSNKLRARISAFTTKRQQSLGSPSPLTHIPRCEYLARGWDANNNQWRSVLWPALDKHFRAADFEGTSPVWNIQCPWKKDTTKTGTNTQP
jgi:hypothetical protein